MNIEYVKASIDDCDEVIDLANYVFSAAHGPTDFPTLLPKLYSREYFMDSIHYIAKEDSRIKAVVGAYPLEMKVMAETLPGRGIGMVSVHPYARSRGYMKTLMNIALEDMRHDGVVFSCLAGQRQRYEYFGYTPLGTLLTFDCNKRNTRHTLGPDFVSSLSLKRLTEKDDALLDAIHQMHGAKPCRATRQRDRLFALLSSWRANVYAISGSAFLGYLIQRGNDITELNLSESERYPEVIKLLLDTLGEESVTVRARPEEQRKIAVLSGFAESCKLRSAYSFAFFDFYRTLKAFVKLTCATRRVSDGSVIIKIGDDVPFTLTVSGGTPSFTPATGHADISLPSMAEAARFFFSWITPFADEQTKALLFLQSLLPLPLSWESADEV
ncbi:MAG: GNAT family N-acetyltransferase [Treponema sp.]|jgi:predicted N-acetyltransferase YhbS|nr:GNAT family N-acetyltransferase [Treponema sp.]